MKTLLIVEDEKLIRRGIKAMVQRSGVPVEVIIECSNGEAALEILKEQKIDVMLTDIRMPKMDGLELVRQMQSCEHIPATVVISGYDDFSYAVEMLRNGVREYLLKPIVREKFTEILRQLNDELENQGRQEKANKRMGWQQIKQLMLGNVISLEEKAAIERHYEDAFFKGEYYVCCQNSHKRNGQEEGNFIFLEDVEDNDIFIVPKENIRLILKNELHNGYVGISSVYQGIRQLSTAYDEAVAMRRQAFLRCKEAVLFAEYTIDSDRIHESLAQEAEKLVSEEVNLQRVHLLGTQRTEELTRSFDKLFFAAGNGHISAEQFEDSIRSFLEDVAATYRNLFSLGGGEALEEQLKDCIRIWNEDSIDGYKRKFMRFILLLQEKLDNQADMNKSDQKIEEAVKYIEAHYAEDLNMAVVSNHISMNYSLFSYSFKQYTGSNFVNFLKDIRMREAQKLLADTDMRIIEISRKVGYDNEKHFMKLFKNTYGVSPTEYRKNMNR